MESNRLTTLEPEQMDFNGLLFPGRKVLYVSEVAGRLQVSERHVIDLIEEGKLRALNVGGDNASGRKFYRIPVEAYEAYLKAAAV